MKDTGTSRVEVTDVDVFEEDWIKPIGSKFIILEKEYNS